MALVFKFPNQPESIHFRETVLYQKGVSMIILSPDRISGLRNLFFKIFTPAVLIHFVFIRNDNRTRPGELLRHCLLHNGMKPLQTAHTGKPAPINNGLPTVFLIIVKMPSRVKHCRQGKQGSYFPLQSRQGHGFKISMKPVHDMPVRFLGSPATAAGLPARESFLVISQLIKKAFMSTRNITFCMEHAL